MFRSNLKGCFKYISEVRHALRSMKNDKTSGKDSITSELIKAAGPQLWKILANKFSRYLQEQRIPSDWKQSRTVLLYKKNDKRDLKNYRPICLLSQMYKLFTRIILNRISSTLEEQQPKEQAGFRKGYSSTDHLHVYATPGNSYGWAWGIPMGLFNAGKAEVIQGRWNDRRP